MITRECENKFLPVLNEARRHEHMWWSGGIVQAFLASTLAPGEWSAALLDSFTAGERIPGTHLLRGWIASEPVCRLWRREKSCPCLESNPGPSLFQLGYTTLLLGILI
jgi:hypothetical protein